MKERLKYAIFVLGFSTFVLLIANVLRGANGVDLNLDTIITTIITLCGTIAAVGVVEIVGWKKVLNRMGDCKNKSISERFNDVDKQFDNAVGVDKNVPCLTKQHRDIINIIEKDLIAKIKESSDSTNNMYSQMKTENELRKQREMLLSQTEYKLVDSINNLSSFKDLWEEKIEIIHTLSNEIFELKSQNEELKRTIDKQEKTISVLQSKQQKSSASKKTNTTNKVFSPVNERSDGENNLDDEDELER